MDETREQKLARVAIDFGKAEQALRIAAGEVDAARAHLKESEDRLQEAQKAATSAGETLMHAARLVEPGKAPAAPGKGKARSL